MGMETVIRWEGSTIGTSLGIMNEHFACETAFFKLSVRV